MKKLISMKKLIGTITVSLGLAVTGTACGHEDPKGSENARECLKDGGVIKLAEAGTGNPRQGAFRYWCDLPPGEYEFGPWIDTPESIEEVQPGTELPYNYKLRTDD